MTGERLLGLDIGSRRIGVAVSDELGTIASPVGMIDQRKDVAAQLRQLIATYSPARTWGDRAMGASAAPTGGAIASWPRPGPQTSIEGANENARDIPGVSSCAASDWLTTSPTTATAPGG